MPDSHINRIRRIIQHALRDTSVHAEFERFGAAVDGGKMLRGRLVLDVGSAARTAAAALDRLGAAVELLHGASLLHDDVVDGGTRRRHEPAVWVSEGAKAAVLLGDLMMAAALGLVREAGAQHLDLMTRTLKEMCDAEAEQEFSRHAHLGSWDDCVRIARRKTGSLFGFAAACAAGDNTALAEALNAAGRDLGTAYQLADDMLDAATGPAPTDKSLGTDAASGKLTAVRASALAGIDPARTIADLLANALNALTATPPVQQAWRRYTAAHIQPVIEQFTGAPLDLPSASC